MGETELERLGRELRWRERNWISDDDRKWEQEERYRNHLRERIKKLESQGGAGNREAPGVSDLVTEAVCTLPAHLYPESLIRASRKGDIGDLLAWECGRCGEWVSELRPRTPCSGDGSRRTEREG